jgi:hypothetical protein
VDVLQDKLSASHAKWVWLWRSFLPFNPQEEFISSVFVFSFSQKNPQGLQDKRFFFSDIFYKDYLEKEKACSKEINSFREKTL